MHIRETCKHTFSLKIGYDIDHKVGIFKNTSHTISDWCNFLREFCEQDWEENALPIGELDEDGFSKIVKINKPKFFHRIYHCGQQRARHWVFGGGERGTDKCFPVFYVFILCRCQ